ncbi:aldehyde dehydrogenase [Polymorphobacter multimanifer]|uniref:aldehyde dehydrogenase family protein n=1 Tax=Polymorphobacter multimanifer TaxID=1070431 RepID=UPI00166DBC7B|nr:aldehyde dehydrogenase family protein [Polymorphobacter multimanifer]GGI74880.1 aldehyde dehydrogenase [Polymorphobacter multimanifer]
MRDYRKFYIGGEWVEPAVPNALDVINPATEAVAGRISLGSEADVDRAVAAAAAAFPGYARTSRAERIELLGAIAAEYQKRMPEIASAITEEMGAPGWLAMQAQAALGIGHVMTALEVLKTYSFDEMQGTTLIAKEPIGVCAFITPWNWPINQIACKVAPALATGCTMVLKPSEIAPFSAILWAEVLHAAGVPAGGFNLVNGDGPTVGAALSRHPQVDMVSFTGSTRAGVEVARAAAPTVKRVHQELGGKSANIILEDADLAAAVTGGIKAVMMNSGQSCNAPTRMLVPAGRMEEAKAIAKSVAEGTTVGSPDGNAAMGPVVSQTQYDKIQGLIEKGIAEGATLVAGGPGKPEGLETGYYVKPTIFADVTNDMTIAREEIFGPVLAMLAYEGEDAAIAMANDTIYGLAGYVQGSPEKAKAVARQLRAGQVNINGAGLDLAAPFGGYKQSGNGREWGPHAFAEFLETKAIIGWGLEAAE